VIQKPAAKPDGDSPKGTLKPDAEPGLTHPFMVSDCKEQSNPSNKAASSLSSEETSKPGVTSSYSKRANRGYNPKYEQSAFVSFGPLCGSKRKNPEPPVKAETQQRVSARVLNLSKEESKSSHQLSLPKVEEAHDELLEEASEDLGSEEEEEVFSDEEDEDEDEDESEGDGTVRRRHLSSRHYDLSQGGLRGSRTNCKGHWSKEEVSYSNLFLFFISDYPSLCLCILINHPYIYFGKRAAKLNIDIGLAPCGRGEEARRQELEEDSGGASRTHGRLVPAPVAEGFEPEPDQGSLDRGGRPDGAAPGGQERAIEVDPDR
jgi:hypothetical protein